MDIKKYSHKIKVFHDRWLKKPKEVEISLPYVPQDFTRPDEVVESFHIDWEEEKKRAAVSCPKGVIKMDYVIKK
jgi:ribosomal protein L13E